MLKQIKCGAYLIIKGEVVVQVSYRGGENIFYFSRKWSIYFNIKGDGNVIQTSLRG